MDQQRAQKGLAQPQAWAAWHAVDVSTSPEQGEACEQAGVARARQAKRTHTQVSTWTKYRVTSFVTKTYRHAM